MTMHRISVIDSHTGGEPTRVVLAGMPDLGTRPMAERARIFREHHDDFRRIVVEEPRGSEILVGALWLPPYDPAHLGGVLFFNNVGPIGMCGHGTIGLLATLKYKVMVEAGKHTIETAVGPVVAELHPDGRVSVENVPSHRSRADVALEIPGHGTIHGDVAWGGNWFFLCQDHGFELTRGNAPELMDFTRRLRAALERDGITGENGGAIDHIELVGPPHDPRNSARNFVLCPGFAYDRSPCGTGTSAKLACLAADGELKPGEIWRQESITGSVFEGSYRSLGEGRIVPTITGIAYVTAESTLLVDEGDPQRL